MANFQKYSDPAAANEYHQYHQQQQKKRAASLDTGSGLSVVTHSPRNSVDERRQRKLDRRRYSPDQHAPDDSSSSYSSDEESLKTTPSKSSPNRLSLHTGYKEAKHFAGGIIHHPAESTKHFTILRHSHGLVFYQGTATSIAISVFADTSLPADRKFWLKAKSWSSGTAKNKATFRHQTEDLLDVTPTHAIDASQIEPSNERAWQRDILQFEKRTRRGPRSRHVLRETAVIRIPAEAGDGYFQIAMCVGNEEEALCISPVFRILSVSPSMGGVSGANWATLPFELGAMALTMVATKKAAGLVLPVKLAAKSKMGAHMPAHVTESRAKQAAKASMMAYGATGAADKVGRQIEAFQTRYHEEREGPFTPVFKIDDDYENGPREPYPIRFTARYQNTGAQDVLERHIVPVGALTNLPDVALYRLSGYYFAWCSPAPKEGGKNDRRKKRQHWFPSIIVVSPVIVNQLDLIKMSHATKKHVQIQVLTDKYDLPDPGAIVNIAVLGCIRPWDDELETLLLDDMKAGEEVAFETAMINETSDIMLTQTILDNPAWGPEVRSQEDAEPKQKKHGLERLKQEYVDTRHTVQKQLDKVPLHRVGVRMPVDKMKEKAVIINGYYIER